VQVYDVTRYGAVGDGVTLNTRVFEKVVALVAEQGYGTIVLPSPGEYLSAPFNLTSNLLFVVEPGATLLASNDTSLWPLLPPLPSYGQGRDHPGWRYTSFLHGDGVANLTITGGGTIDGQGARWWKEHDEGKEKYTRGRLIEIMNCEQLRVTNLTLLNSPFWTVHPVYCNDVVASDLTILAPVDSPNTDGIDPDSCTNVLIERCYVESGDDGIAIKSGWDCYGQEFNRPTINVTVRDFVRKGISSAGIAIGSEVSGGVGSILLENITVIAEEGEHNTNAIHLKTGKTRGGYIRDVSIRDLHVQGASLGIKIAKDYKSPNPSCANFTAPVMEFIDLPIVRNITVDTVTGDVRQQAFVLTGLWYSPVDSVSITNVKLNVTAAGLAPAWKCEYLTNSTASNVAPPACPQLSGDSGGSHGTAASA